MTFLPTVLYVWRNGQVTAGRWRDETNANKWVTLARTACDHAGIRPGSIEIVATWNQRYCANAVFRLGSEYYLKLFGPSAENQFHIERAVLHTLAGQHLVPAPRIVADGAHKREAPYLILRAVPGPTMEEAWDSLSRAGQLAVARELGTLTAAIQRLPQARLAAVEEQFGGKAYVVDHWLPRWSERIEQAGSLSAAERGGLLHFLQGEAQYHLDGPAVLSHFDLSHNHIYLSGETRQQKISAIIDWGEAVLGPAEWDISFLWFWTFSGDREAMRACLATLYPDGRFPDHFARRCVAAFFHTHGMGLVWPDFLERGGGTGSVVRRLTAFLFPPEVFGPPD